MGHKINEAVDDAVSELLEAWLDGERFRDLDVYDHVPEIIYTSDLIEHLEEDYSLLFLKATGEERDLFDVIRDALYEEISERVYLEIREWEEYDSELTEMIDEGWKFSINGSDLIAIDEKGVQHTRYWEPDVISDLYDEVYLKGLDEEDSDDDE